ncbi:MAG: dihydropteroate synthase [Candidatus Cloacimonetes bacterium]|nr:dihydropteroate synthase [Candidatus Cloacimonadota bacterium]MBS3766720.1 dihydropteroate synthase [Candidatus Cloacimonadota bacterium]
MNRILSIKNDQDLRKELEKIKVSTQGIDAMFKKGRTLCIKLKNIKIGAANIIKQDMLSIGGDAAVARGVVNGKVDKSDVIIFGDEKRIKLLLKKISYQDIFGIPKIIKEIKKLLKFRNQPQSFIKVRGKELSLKQTLIMGILNVTPDSFFDGGKYEKLDRAKKRIDKMVSEGAHIIDIGGESTRPFAEKVSMDEELNRVIPVIKAAKERCDLPVSIDTYKAEVAKEALDAGADIVNDISGLRFDENMAEVVAAYDDVPIIIMHIQGTPRNMQKNPSYEDVIEDIYSYFQDRIKFARQYGVKEENIILDPGIGFGKTLEHNVEIINRISEFHSLGRPILLGCSNKSYLENILGVEKEERLPGTMATNALAIMQDVQIIRVHQIKENKMLAQTLNYIRSR